MELAFPRAVTSHCVWGSYVCVVSNDTLFIHAFPSGSLVTSYKDPDGTITALCAHRNELIIGTHLGNIRFLFLGDELKPHVGTAINLHSSRIESITTSGPYIVTAGMDGYVHLSPLNQRFFVGQTWSGKVSIHGDYVFCGTYEGKLIALPLQTEGAHQS